MQTLHLTLTLPDRLRFGDQEAAEMQLLYAQRLLDSGRLDLRDPAQRQAVWEWYQQLRPHLAAAELQALKHHFELPAQDRPAADIVADLDAEMERLEKANHWTAATYAQWLTERLRAAPGRS